MDWQLCFIYVDNNTSDSEAVRIQHLLVPFPWGEDGTPVRGDPRGLDPEEKWEWREEVLMEERGCIGKFGTVSGVPAPMASEVAWGVSAGVTGGKEEDKEEVDGREAAGGSIACWP